MSEIKKKIAEVEAQLKRKNFADAVAQGEKLLKEHPLEVPLLRVVGFAYLGLKEFEEARAKFEVALKHDEKESRALSAVGKSYLAQRRFSDAVWYFRQAFEKGMEAPDAFEDWYQAEKGLEENGDPRSVLLRALQICKMHEQQTLTWLERLVKSGGLNKAVENAMTVYARTFPENREIQKLRIRASAQKGLIERALKELEDYRLNVGHDSTWLELFRYIHSVAHPSV